MAQSALLRRRLGVGRIERHRKEVDMEGLAVAAYRFGTTDSSSPPLWPPVAIALAGR